jgi:hypothetical protein
MEVICCVTGYSFFDVWFLAHLGIWIFVASTLWNFKANKWISLAICLGIALSWEFFEYFYAYPLWPQHWKDPESWWNSLLSDPLTCIVAILGVWYLWDHRKRRTASTSGTPTKPAF